MAENTKIEWADDTANFWEGCTQVSPACDFCYAKSRAERFKTVEWNGPPRKVKAGPLVVHTAQQLARSFEVTRFVFINSLSDFFDNQAPQEWRDEALDLMGNAPDCVFLLLTKRVGNVIDMLGARAWPQNAWLGITVVNQAEADRDIPKLLATKDELQIQRVFLSCEPLLGAISLVPAFAPECRHECAAGTDPETGYWECRKCDDGEYETVDWVIAGGESGANARPMHPDWARSLRDQCAAASVPFLFKQWGEYGPCELHPAGSAPLSVVTSSGKHLTGRSVLDQPDDDRAEIIGHFGKVRAGRKLDGIEHDGRPSPTLEVLKL